MRTITEKDLLKAQQGEIDAVIVYKRLADRIAKDNSEVYDPLQKLAADEGRHASMLHKITGKVCRPKNTLANIVICMSYIIGKKRLLQFMAKTEHKALESYKPFVAQYPELESMRLDEGRHGDILEDIIKKMF